MTYKIRFVHKIAPKPAEYHDRTVDLPDGFHATKLSLGTPLRLVGALMPGQRLYEVRTEKDGRICAFPCAWRGITAVWHCIILEPQP